jgi:hypothetical protein
LLTTTQKAHEAMPGKWNITCMDDPVLLLLLNVQASIETKKEIKKNTRRKKIKKGKIVYTYRNNILKVHLLKGNTYGSVNYSVLPTTNRLNQFVEHQDYMLLHTTCADFNKHLGGELWSAKPPLIDHPLLNPPC